MKKIFLIIAILCLTSLSCYADTMKVMALSSISTTTPNKPICVLVMEDMRLTQDIDIKKGYVVKGYMSEILEAHRLKMDATFYFTPTEYITPENVSYEIKEQLKGKYSPKFEVNTGEIAKAGALIVADHVVKNISIGYYAVEGAVKNKDGNVLKSSVNNVYKNSVLSYIEKGQSVVNIPQNQCFSFKFPSVLLEECKNNLP